MVVTAAAVVGLYFHLEIPLIQACFSVKADAAAAAVEFVEADAQWF